MKIKIFTFCLILLIPFTALGGDKVKLAKEIMELTNVNQVMKQVEVQFEQMQNQMISQLNIPSDKKVKAQDFQNKLRKKMFEIMSPDKMEKEYLELFTSVYTTEELRGIVKFYKSPVGKSMLEKNPIIIKKVMEMSQNKVRVLMPELQKMVKEFEQELKEK
jgi:hypothetical protein